MTPIVFPQLVIPHNAQYADEQGNVSPLEGSRNCAAASGAALANVYPQKAFVTHHAFRLAAGDPRDADGKPLGLGSAQCLAAFTKLGVPASRHYGESYTVARQALVDGHALQAAVDYGVVNDDYPALSGDRRFRGGHSWCVYGFTAADPRLGGRNSVLIAEGLYDERKRDTWQAPSSPQLAPFGAVRSAMGAFHVGGKTYAEGHPIGKDLGIFVVVPSPTVDPAPKPPTPDPCADCEAEIAELERRLSEKDGYLDKIAALAAEGRKV